MYESNTKKEKQGAGEQDVGKGMWT